MPLGHWSLLFFLCFGGGSFLLLRVTYPCAHCPFCKPNNRTKPVRLHRRDTTPRPVPRNETKGSTRTTTLFTYEEIKGHTAMVPSLPFDANPAASREREVISMWAHPVAFHLCGSSANGAPTVQPLLLRERGDRSYGAPYRSTPLLYERGFVANARGVLLAWSLG